VSRGILPLDASELLQQANLDLIKGDAARAVPKLMECLKKYPNFTEPYTTLAATFEMLGETLNALHCYAIALHMKPSDKTIAMECATKSAGALQHACCHACRALAPPQRHIRPHV
jgi:Flp pilus assembly protein TadD